MLSEATWKSLFDEEVTKTRNNRKHVIEEAIRNDVPG
jgi:hypothetical protein